MFRATTPVHEFIFYDDPSEYVKILITYTQKGHIILEKTKDDLSFETYTPSDGSATQYIASLQLSQEETKLFHTYNGPVVSVQVRALDDEGNAFASEKQMVQLKDVFNDTALMIGSGEQLELQLRLLDGDDSSTATVYAVETHTIQLMKMFSDAIVSEMPEHKFLEARIRLINDEGQTYVNDVHLVSLDEVLSNE